MATQKYGKVGLGHGIGGSVGSAFRPLASYSLTQAWAAALYEQGTDAQGLLRTSRQDDLAQSLILLGPRVKPSAIAVEQPGRSLLMPDGTACTEVQDLALRLGVLLV